MSLISVVIPCFNYGWLLAETLDSLLLQTFKNWEAIIIDDGSTDNTFEVVERYISIDERFHYVYQKNRGMSAARNRGLLQARGKYIQFLDSDDMLAPRKLEKQVAFLEVNDDVDLIYSDMRYFKHEKMHIISRSSDMQDTTWMAEVDGQGNDLIDVLVEKCIMVINAPLIKSSVFDLVGKFSEDMRSVEDWEFWIRCAIAGTRFHYDKDPDMWALVRIHPASTSQNMFRMNAYELIMRKKISKLLFKNKLNNAVEINDKAIKKLKSHVGPLLAMQEIENGNLFLGAIKYLKLAHNTGRYIYYIKSILYWTVKRSAKFVNK